MAILVDTVLTAEGHSVTATSHIETVDPTGAVAVENTIILET